MCISIHFSVLTTGGQSQVEVGGGRKTFGTVGKEVHLRAGQNGILGKAQYVRKSHSLILSKQFCFKKTDEKVAELGTEKIWFTYWLCQFF